MKTSITNQTTRKYLSLPTTEEYKTIKHNQLTGFICITIEIPKGKNDANRLNYRVKYKIKDTE